MMAGARERYLGAAVHLRELLPWVARGQQLEIVSGREEKGCVAEVFVCWQGRAVGRLRVQAGALVQVGVPAGHVEEEGSLGATQHRG